MHVSMQEPLIGLVFTAVVAVGVLLQAGVLLAILFAMKAAAKRVEKIAELVEQVEGNASPVLKTAKQTLTAAKQLMDEVGPKLKTAANNLAEASETLGAQAKRLNESLGGLLKKTETQAERVDEMITSTLNSVADATAALQRAIVEPVRQVSAILNALRAALDALRGRSRQAHAAADGDRYA
jgi:ABC-type transporter Mla subunit MlaD